MDETLLSIGELAAASGVSPKALRLYADSGLLVPRRVDPFTGYRSYGADQVERARLIAALRGLGMGLARIGVLCDLEPGAAAAELRSWWRQEEADALSRAAAVDDLARDLGELPSEGIMTASTTTPRTASVLHIGLVRAAQQDAPTTWRLSCSPPLRPLSSRSSPQPRRPRPSPHWRRPGPRSRRWSRARAMPAPPSPRRCSTGTGCTSPTSATPAWCSCATDRSSTSPRTTPGCAPWSRRVASPRRRWPRIRTAPC